MTDDTKRKIAKSKTKYKAAYAEDVVKYFEECLEKRTKAGIIEKIPSYVAFSRKIGVTVRTIENWRKNKPKFDEACAECDELLKAAIIGDSLTFHMHASFGKFLLSARYGMKEKVEVTQDREGMVEISPELAELLNQNKERGKKA